MTRPSSIRIAFCACLSLLALTACGKSDTGQNSPAGGRTASEGVAEDEAVALSAPQFTAPILVRVNADAYQQSQQLEALNGVDPRATNGAAYERTAFAPCGASIQDAAFTVQADMDGPARGADLVNALTRSSLYRFSSYNIQYPNRTSNDNGTYNIFVCAVRADDARDYFLPADRGRDIHGPVSLLFSRRLFLDWTYRNRYEAPVSGRGSLKVFAGTMSYKMDVVMPIGSYNGDGTASVRVTLNPDTGKWEVESYELHDPELTLR
jgi:hypothetical protein